MSVIVWEAAGLPLVQAACDCGWRGPIRDARSPRGRGLARLDKQDHDNCLRRTA